MAAPTCRSALARWSTAGRRAYATTRAQQQPAAKGSVDAMEEELRALQHMRRLPAVYASTDVWGAPVANLDVQIPYQVGSMLGTLFARRPYDSRKVKQLKDVWYAVKHNLDNWVKNTFCMLTVAKANAFPGVANVELRVRPVVWRRLSNVQSHDRSSWLAPLRKMALDTYRETNAAVARQNEEVVKRLTVGELQSKTLQLVRRREKGHRWFWDITSDTSDAALYVPDPTLAVRLRSLVARVLRRDSLRPVAPPVTVVSVRAAEIYLAEQEPRIGNRLVIQALVRFDTTQVLRVTDRQGRPVESELAKPHRVVQYMLLEKIGWYDCPWKLKEQIYRA